MIKTLHHELTRRRVAKGDLEPVRNRPMRCQVCRSPHIVVDMLVDLRTLPAQVLEQMGFKSTIEWVCTGCVHTAHNLGLITHSEIQEHYNASPEIKEWARQHDIAHPFPQGTWAHAFSFDLANQELDLTKP